MLQIVSFIPDKNELILDFLYLEATCDEMYLNWYSFLVNRVMISRCPHAVGKERGGEQIVLLKRDLQEYFSCTLTSWFSNL